jgi:hypothetical protein
LCIWLQLPGVEIKLLSVLLFLASIVDDVFGVPGALISLQVLLALLLKSVLLVLPR